MTADPRALRELLEESKDLQADALRQTHDALDEFVEFNQGSGEEDLASTEMRNPANVDSANPRPRKAAQARRMARTSRPRMSPAMDCNKKSGPMVAICRYPSEPQRWKWM